jgi:hypothetical protein
VTGIAVGTCTIQANQAGDLNWNAAPMATLSFVVKGTQVITFGPAPKLVGGGDPATVSATSSSGLAVALTSWVPEICTISGTVVTGHAVGDCIIAANQPGNAFYYPANEVTQTIAIVYATVVRYRLYSPGTFEHLYTTDVNEASVLPACCGWTGEGPAYKVLNGPATIGGVTALPNYRLYNPSSHQHHWTLDANEYSVLAGLGWSQEGTDGYILPMQVAGSVPLYRLYLNASGGLHLWTTDAHERSVLTSSSGWVDEGIAGYVFPLN